ncbi:methylamine utilization protein [Marinomonas rhizomae]|uniref:Plastocyanin n=1 Tax=Marinomonas rhizomae TaxID=491948 RepID=A0A366IXM6_9GAMM|nr:methylamine utilization protein [Marinomonas rhizomae]RBP78585.1 plastocyanin [Marinomonas rhizomae]RNF70226.1 methylamine utilization protein [Marinomonas rhizomae]
MRYLFALVSIFMLQNAFAAMTLTLIDQDNEPVADAVILVSKAAMRTPDTVAVMDQIDESFVPRVLVVQKGQSVSFPNSDDIRHHVYSFSEPKAFEIKLYKGSDIPPVVFDKAGLVILGCNIHDDMIGYIMVADNAYAVKTGKDGKVSLPVKMGDSVSLWSERLVEGVSTMKQIDVTSDTAQTVQLELLPAIEATDHGSMYNGFGEHKW